MKMKKLFDELPEVRGIDLDNLDIEGKKELLRSLFPAFNQVADRLIRAKWTGPKTDKTLSTLVQAVGDIIDVPGMGGFDFAEYTVKDEWNKVRFSLVMFAAMPCIIKPKGRRILRVIVEIVDDILDNHVEE